MNRITLLLGMESASDAEIWQAAKGQGEVSEA